MATSAQSLTAELRERVHGPNALTAAPPPKSKAWDESATAKGWGSKFSEDKVKRDTDPGEEGQFDFKDDSKKKGGGGKGRKGPDPKKEAERAAKKAQAEMEKRARDARAAERKKATERKASAAKARSVKMRKPADIQGEIADIDAEIAAEAAARGLKPTDDYPGKKDLLRKKALLQVELADSQLGDDAPIAERIALRERNLEAARKAGVDPYILDALETDLEEFRSHQGEVEGAQSDRKTKAAEAEKKKEEAAFRKAEADRKRKEADEKKSKKDAYDAQRRGQTTAVSESQRKQQLAMRGIQSSGNTNLDQRREAAIKGHALPDGSYPILSAADWHKASAAAKRAPYNKTVDDHLKKRGKALGIDC